jgi:16S rRNA (cytidine1402-2'-O)-methyltransferase
MKAGTLYVVATPIGNLEDISARAVRILGEVDLVLAEDTRISARLLRHVGLTTALAPLHAHNERQRNAQYLAMLKAGKSLAIVSDAGTPLISDPGLTLVRSAKDHDIAVVPIPGACSVTAALSVSGLPATRFAFEGFLPTTAVARRRKLEALRGEERTMVFFEAPHRVRNTLADLVSVFGADRPACLAREMTKVYETIVTRPLGDVFTWVESDPDQRRGEFVICVQGTETATGEIAEGLRVAGILTRFLSPSQSAAAASLITGVDRRQIYKQLLPGSHREASDT